MILVDTSIWIDHLRTKNAALVHLLGRAQVVVHPLVVGELAMGSLSNRSLLNDLLALPSAEILSHEDVLRLVERQQISGRGIGFVDAHLLASCAAGRDQLWTRDRRLAMIAEEIGLAFPTTT